MGKFINFNSNPRGNHVGDCTVRAISAALDQEWEETYLYMALYGFLMCDMPSADHVWGAYLKHKGFRRYVVDDGGRDAYTVADFCAEHPAGVFILCPHGHVLTVKDGNYYDNWDSGGEVPVYYWAKEDK